MSDKIDYTQRNVKYIIGEYDPDDIRGPQLNFYKEDGSPNYWKEPSKEEADIFLKKFLIAADEVDLRDLFFFLSHLNLSIRASLNEALQMAHSFAHEHPDDYDEDKLCDGIKSYLSHAPKSEDITGANSEEEVLKRFFPDKSKPH